MGDQPPSLVPMRKLAQFLRSAVKGRLTGYSQRDDPAHWLRYERKYDSTRNADTTPPEDEHIELCRIWAVEFYTPSYVDKLVDNLTTLGWDESDFPGRESPVSWVQISRQISRVGSLRNLGVIRSAEDKRSWPRRDRTAPLPKGVRYALGSLYSLTPSITCVVMCFVVEDNLRSQLDEILRKDRRTVTRPFKTGEEILDPEVQKTEEVRRVRQDWVNIAFSWFRDNLPGVFSSGLLGDQLPTYELVTLRNAEPFPNRESQQYTPTGYMRVLNLEFSPFVLRHRKAPNLKFALTLSRRSPEYHSVFAVRGTEIEGMDPATYLELDYHAMIGELAIQHLLEGYDKRLNECRDTITARIRRPSRRRPLHTLQVVVDNVAFDMDIPTITTELIASTEGSSRMYRDLESFEPYQEWGIQGPLAQQFRDGVNRYATNLMQVAQSLRDHLTQFGSLIAATEDVRTQNRILWLTVIVAVLAGVTFISSDAVSTLSGWLNDTWRLLGLWRG